MPLRGAVSALNTGCCWVSSVPGFEGTGRLKIIELEEDAASLVLVAAWRLEKGHFENVPSSSLGESGGLDQWGADPRLGKRFRSYAAHDGLKTMLKRCE